MIILSRTKEDKARSSELSVRDIDRAVKEMCLPTHPRDLSAHASDKGRPTPGMSR
jgi:hypothetical protein